MSITDDLLRHNAVFAATFRPRPDSSTSAEVAVVACMDARLDPAAVLGLAPGVAHVIRNAGGILTEDVMRSLVISQRLLGTTEVLLIHHSDCGMQTFSAEALADAIEQEVGTRPPFEFGTFADVEADLRTIANAIRESPLLLHKAVRGFVYEVNSGRLREVDVA